MYATLEKKRHSVSPKATYCSSFLRGPCVYSWLRIIRIHSSQARRRQPPAGLSRVLHCDALEKPQVIHTCSWCWTQPTWLCEERFWLKTIRCNLCQSTHNQLYAHGQRETNILYASIRTGCSCLNAHIFQNYTIDSPRCAYGDQCENSFHYFFACPRFVIQGHDLQIAISEITSCSIGTILYGSKLCAAAQNRILFIVFELYTRRTKRFR